MPDMDRRTFLAGTAAAATTAAVATSRAGAVVKKVSASSVSAADPRFAGARHAAVLGGGCGGLSAAHELIERGFTVDINERYPVAGGKCRSIPSPGTGSGGRADLPGEHGFRFFPGYYRHVIDTMARIPYGSNPNGVKDNLTFGETARFSRKDALDVPFPYKKLLTVNPITDLPQALVGLLGVIPGLKLDELLYFATRLTEFVTSCDARRDNQYDKLSWWDFVRAERFSPLYQNLLTRSLTRNLVAAQAEQASTRTIGLQATRILVGNILFSMYDEASRLLNAPTTEAWIDPWLSYLEGKGVRWFPDTAVDGLELTNGTVSGVRVRGGGQATTVTADVYVLAVGAHVDLAGPVLEARPVHLRQRIGPGRRLGRRVELGRPRRPVRQDGAGLHPRGDLRRGLAADEGVPERGRDHPARRRRGGPVPRPRHHVRARRDAGRQRRAAAHQHGRLVGQAAGRRHEDPQPVPGVGLREDQHRPGHHGGRQRGRPPGGDGVLDLTGWSGARARIWTIPEPPLFAFARAEDGFRYALGLPHKLSDRR